MEAEVKASCSITKASAQQVLENVGVCEPIFMSQLPI